MLYRFLSVLVLGMGALHSNLSQTESSMFRQAALENRIIVTIVLGSQECLWSEKFRQEILEDPQFLQNMGSDAAVWCVHLKEEREEEAFRKRFHIDDLPVVLLMDPRGKEFARLGFLPLDARGYGQAIGNLIEDFQLICAQVEGNFDEVSWKGLYAKAKQLSTPYYKNAIVERGIKEEKGVFFHLERYAELLQKSKQRTSKVQKWKEKILEIDKKKACGARFQIAALEFQKNVLGFKKGDRLEKALKPLLRYVSEFGKKEPHALWQAELMIAEFLCTQEEIESALQHAQRSYDAAPEDAKSRIADTITLIERKKA
ncbi:MAG: hypothetical protein V4492_02395 [Chlamydiota bacterium]